MKEDLTKFKFRKNHSHVQDDSNQKIIRKKPKARTTISRGRGRGRRMTKRRRLSSLEEDSAIWATPAKSQVDRDENRILQLMQSRKPKH